MNKLAHLAISNDNFAFDPSTGLSFSINESAKDAIEFLIKGKDESELVKYFSHKYKISEEEAFIDVMDFYTKLRVFNLVDIK